MQIYNFLFILLFASCITAQKTSHASRYIQQANELAHKFIISDGHVDLPYRLKVNNFRLEKRFMGIPIKTDLGDFDYVRAKTGGLDAPFMSIYIPSSYEGNGAKVLADSLIDMVQGIAAEHPDKFAIASSPDDVRMNFNKGIISLPMGMENGAPIEGKLDHVKYFKQRGISYITLTHAKDNHICDSSYDTTRTWNGLSPFGREVVLEMNRSGIMVDVSHISDSAFYQVLALTNLPVIASHSSCRKFTPGFERNMNDDMLKHLAANGGVIQINFGSSFLDSKVQEQNDANRTALSRLLAEKGLTLSDQKSKPIVDKFQKDNPTLFADVKTVADHIDHAVAMAGINHVGLGSDFDGVGDSLPTGLKDVSAYPNLIAELLYRGYSENDIEKICSGNIFRVWQKVLDAANH
ncbi:MAG: membrane dipeptidase [Saprospiraceae bacterium]|nr:membrane dipeptidase [Saprospiraceae bacterium]